jgi:hypothetical protein
MNRKIKCVLKATGSPFPANRCGSCQTERIAEHGYGDSVRRQDRKRGMVLFVNLSGDVWGNEIQ